MSRKLAYLVINDTDDLDALQSELCDFTSEVDDTIIDYSLDELRFNALIGTCNYGDTIYSPYVGRVARSLSDLYDVVSLAKSKGVELIFYNSPIVSFSEKSEIGNFNFSALKLATSLDLEIKKAKRKAETAAAIEQIKREGHRITKRGTIQKHWGSEKGTDETKRIMEIARAESIRVKQEAAIAWKHQSKAYQRTISKHKEGWSVTQIANDLSDMYDVNPNEYSTPNGCRPSKGTVSKWLKGLDNY